MSKHSRTEYSYLNILAGVGGYSVSIILSLFNRMVFTRTLPADYLGINGLFTNILSMLSLAELGIGGAIVYALYKPLAEDDHEKVASIVKLFGKAYAIIGTVIFVAGLCLMPFLTLIIGEHPEIPENLYLIFGLFLFNTASSYFFTYRSTLLTAAQQNYYNTGINYLILSIQEVIQAAYLLLTHEYIGYLIIQVIGGLAYNIIISKVAVRKFPYISEKHAKPLPKDETKKIFRNVKDLVAYKVSGVLVNGTDNIIITIFDGIVITGLSSNYSLLVNTLSTLLGQVFNNVTASIGNLNAVESKEKQFHMLNVFNLMNFWLYGWAAIGIIFVSSDLVSLLFGSTYIMDISIPIVLALNFYTVGMINTIWNFKHTMGLFRYGRFIQFGTAALNLVFSIILGYCWGLFGILFATFMARLCTNLWYDPYAVYKFGFDKSPKAYLKKYLVYLLVLSMAICFCWILCTHVHCAIWGQVVIKAAICSIIPNALFYLVFKKTDEYKTASAIIKRGIGLIKEKVLKRP